MYLIEPGEVQVVEANPDPIGLKVGIVYETRREKQEFLFLRFGCSNDSVLTITSLDGEDVDYYGGNTFFVFNCLYDILHYLTYSNTILHYLVEGTSLQAKNKLRESERTPFNLAAEALSEQLAPYVEKKNPIQEVQKMIHNAKEKSEEIIKNVTGKDIDLDITKHFTGKKEKDNTQSPSNSYVGDNNSIADLNGIIIDEGSDDEIHNNSNLMNNIPPPIQTTITNGNNMNNNNNQTKFGGPNDSPGTPVITNRMTRTGSSTDYGNINAKFDEFKAGIPAPLPTAEETRAAEEKWELELDRAKKEKKWELEIERVKKERQLRLDREAEIESILQEEKYQQQLKKTAPMVNTQCSACILS